jgi:CheY-like chemotaxis protein
MGKRILVADDSLTIQKAFAMVLGGQDYTLVAARSVDEAMAAAKGGGLTLSSRTRCWEAAAATTCALP